MKYLVIDESVSVMDSAHQQIPHTVNGAAINLLEAPRSGEMLHIERRYCPLKAKGNRKARRAAEAQRREMRRGKW